jgi:hypothetical protein
MLDLHESDLTGGAGELCVPVAFHADNCASEVLRQALGGCVTVDDRFKGSCFGSCRGG